MKPTRLILAALVALAPLAPALAEFRPAAAHAIIADRQATVGGQRFRYLEAGSRDTLIVLVHG